MFATCKTMPNASRSPGHNLHVRRRPQGTALRCSMQVKQTLMFLDLRFAGVWAVVQRLPAVMPKLYVSCTLCPHSSRACRTCAVIGAIVHLFGAHSTTWTQFSAVVFSQDADHLRHLFHDFSETCQRHALQEPAEWTEWTLANTAWTSHC